MNPSRVWDALKCGIPTEIYLSTVYTPTRRLTKVQCFLVTKKPLHIRLPLSDSQAMQYAGLIDEASHLSTQTDRMPAELGSHPTRTDAYAQTARRQSANQAHSHGFVTDPLVCCQTALSNAVELRDRLGLPDVITTHIRAPQQRTRKGREALGTDKSSQAITRIDSPDDEWSADGRPDSMEKRWVS